jgi:hypothetical protein
VLIKYDPVRKVQKHNICQLPDPSHKGMDLEIGGKFSNWTRLTCKVQSDWNSL